MKLLLLLLTSFSCLAQTFTGSGSFIGTTNPTDGLVGWWKMDRVYGGPLNDGSLVGWWKMDEGSGTTVADSSGSGNSGTLSGVALPLWTNGVIGGGLSFNGSSSYVTSGSTYNLASGGTISLWVNIPTAAIGDTANIVCDVVASGNRHAIGITGGRYGVYYYNGSTVFSYAESGLSTTGWHHLVYVNNGNNTITFYIDGASNVGASAVAAPGASTGFKIGVNSSVTSGWLNGHVDDVRIYNRALTAAEIADIYNKEAPSFAIDSSGYGNHGTLSGAVKPVWTNGITGGGLYFNGADYVDCGTGSASLPTPSITVSCWVYLMALPNPYNAVWSKTSTSQGNYLAIKSNGKLISTYNPTGGNIIYNGSGSQTIPLSNWTHIVSTYSSTAGLTNYVNTAVDYSIAANGTLTNSTSKIYIGGDDFNVRYTTGIIDDFRLYNRALNATEVLQLYNNGRGQ